SAAGALIGGDILAVEVAKSNELALRFFQHIFPAGSLGHGEIGPQIDPRLDAGDRLGQGAVGIAQGTFQAFNVTASRELFAVAHDRNRSRLAAGGWREGDEKNRENGFTANAHVPLARSPIATAMPSIRRCRAIRAPQGSHAPRQYTHSRGGAGRGGIVSKPMSERQALPDDA